MKTRIAVATVVLYAFVLSGQTIDLRGTVRNQAEEPVGDLTLTLANAGFTETTDTDGRFAFSGNITAVRHQASGFGSPEPARLDGSQLVLSVRDGRQNVTVDLFTIKGSKVAGLVNGDLSAGEHRIPVVSMIPARISASMLIMVVRQGNLTTRLQLIKTGGRFCISAMRSTSSSGPKAYGKRSSDPFDEVDTLIIERKDTVELRMAIASYEDTLSIQLDLIPWEVLELALSEEGNGPEEVGEDIDEYPFAISNFLAPNEAWCSEFVAWVYRATDYPLSGGSEDGGWMIRSSEGLKRWFQMNTRFVSHSDDDWESFEPSPGDYIRYDYESAGGHSGIVRYAEGSTLYTVEGNVNNMVMLRTIRNYKNYNQTQVDGIGMRSGYLNNDRL